MLPLVASVVAVVTVPVAGGRLSRLAIAPLRLPVLPAIAVAVQAVVLTIDLSYAVATSLHVTSYVPLGVFLAANRRRPGLWLLLLGFALNSVAIIANGGVMPADPDAMRTAGLLPTDDFANSAVVDHARLSWLGDRFALAEWIPFANVFSVGDVAIVLGVGTFAHCTCLSRMCRGRAEP